MRVRPGGRQSVETLFRCVMKAGKAQLQRETLADGIRREMATLKPGPALSDDQAEAAARILRTVLDDGRTEVIATGARHLHAI
jgi:hypothetical protein